MLFFGKPPFFRFRFFQCFFAALLFFGKPPFFRFRFFQCFFAALLFFGKSPFFRFRFFQCFFAAAFFFEFLLFKPGDFELCFAFFFLVVGVESVKADRRDCRDQEYADQIFHEFSSVLFFD